jgi:multicomponent Na+:H+ antiporter subunit E
MKWRDAVALATALSAVWIGWSGHFEPLTLAFGAASVGLVVLVCVRMGIVDRDGNLLRLLPRMLIYTPRLLRRIVRSNIEVASIILSPTLPLTPRLRRVVTTQVTPLAQTVYANSVTLTPGSLTVEVEDGAIIVHTLTEENARAFDKGTMNRFVTRLFDGKKVEKP